MTAMQIFFLIVGLVVLGSALMVVTTGNLIHAALWLIVTLFGVAVLYAILNASFLAVVQVVVYIGAIAILFIFAVPESMAAADGRRTSPNPVLWTLATKLAAMPTSRILRIRFRLHHSSKIFRSG